MKKVMRKVLSAEGRKRIKKL